MAAEQQIIVRLTAKCAEIMECAAYDWTTKEVRERPSDYLNDCLHYLETTFIALQILPVRQHSSIFTTRPLMVDCSIAGGVGEQRVPPGTQELVFADGECSAG